MQVYKPERQLLMARQEVYDKVSSGPVPTKRRKLKETWWKEKQENENQTNEKEEGKGKDVTRLAHAPAWMKSNEQSREAVNFSCVQRSLQKKKKNETNEHI